MIAGRLVHGLDEAVDAVRDVGTFDRQVIRQWAKERFEARRTVREHAELYEIVLEARTGATI